MAKKGYTLVDDDGVQVALFPSQQIYITQGANSPYSHAYTKNMDNACSSDKRDIYAPCDVQVVRNLYSQGYGLVLFQSLKRVRLANGKTDYISFWLMHDDNADRWKVNTIYRQGEHIYTEGKADPSGLTNGIHVHYEVAIGLHANRIKSHADGRYHIVNQVHPDEVFFRNGTELVRSNAPDSWAGDHVYNWKEFKGGSEGGGGGLKPSPKKLTLDIRHLDLKGVIKIGDEYKVVKITDTQIVLEKVNPSLKGKQAIVSGGKGKRLPLYHMNGKHKANLDLSKYNTWYFLIDEIRGNGDIVTTTNAYGKVRFNPAYVKGYRDVK